MRPIDGGRERGIKQYLPRERERERGGIEGVMSRREEVDSYDPLTEVEIWGHTDESREGTVMERTEREDFLDEILNCITKSHLKQAVKEERPLSCSSIK